MLDTLAFGPRAIYDFPARSSREIFYLINVRKGHLEAVEGVSVKYDLSRPNALSTTRSLFRERGSVVSWQSLYSGNTAQCTMYYYASSLCALSSAA